VLTKSRPDRDQIGHAHGHAHGHVQTARTLNDAIDAFIGVGQQRAVRLRLRHRQDLNLAVDGPLEDFFDTPHAAPPTLCSQVAP
jgi:hypothetical protein